jgi:hypothetical protein
MHDFEEVYYIESLFASQTDVDFLGVKIGDINRDLRLNFDSDDIVIRSAHPYVLEISEQPNTSAGVRILDVNADEALVMEGLQMALTLKGMEIVNVLQGSVPLREDCYHIDEAGVLRISWSDIRGVQHVPGQPLFSVVAKTHSAIPTAQRVKLADVLAPEVYTVSGSRPVEINVAGTAIKPVATVPDMQIAPNPFNNEFSVSFVVPEEGKVKFSVYTPLGEQLFEDEATYAAGPHKRTIRLQQFNGVQGLLFCQLTYESTAQTKRVLKQ